VIAAALPVTFIEGIVAPRRGQQPAGVIRPEEILGIVCYVDPGAWKDPQQARLQAWFDRGGHHADGTPGDIESRWYVARNITDTRTYGYALLYLNLISVLQEGEPPEVITVHLAFDMYNAEHRGVIDMIDRTGHLGLTNAPVPSSTSGARRIDLGHGGNIGATVQPGITLDVTQRVIDVLRYGLGGGAFADSFRSLEDWWDLLDAERMDREIQPEPGTIQVLPMYGRFRGTEHMAAQVIATCRAGSLVVRGDVPAYDPDGPAIGLRIDQREGSSALRILTFADGMWTLVTSIELSFKREGHADGSAALLRVLSEGQKMGMPAAVLWPVLVLARLSSCREADANRWLTLVGLGQHIMEPLVDVVLQHARGEPDAEAPALPDAWYGAAAGLIKDLGKPELGDAQPEVAVIRWMESQGARLWRGGAAAWIYAALEQGMEASPKVAVWLTAAWLAVFTKWGARLPVLHPQVEGQDHMLKPGMAYFFGLYTIWLRTLALHMDGAGPPEPEIMAWLNPDVFERVWEVAEEIAPLNAGQVERLRAFCARNAELADAGTIAVEGLYYPRLPATFQRIRQAGVGHLALAVVGNTHGAPSIWIGLGPDEPGAESGMSRIVLAWRPGGDAPRGWRLVLPEALCWEVHLACSVIWRDMRQTSVREIIVRDAGADLAGTAPRPRGRAVRRDQPDPMVVPRRVRVYVDEEGKRRGKALPVVAGQYGLGG